ncbi:hypothetical protein JW926_14835 [Candidatus Sumerlaeota bacterium]|nr:hypothetical protein [Candidatus Sumerlaeota bacterium]
MPINYIHKRKPVICLLLVLYILIFIQGWTVSPSGITSQPDAASAAVQAMNPLRIDITGEQKDYRFIIKTRIENVSMEPLKGSVTWELKPRGMVQTPPQSFSLASHDIFTTQSSLMAGNKEARLVATVKLESGYTKKAGIGLMSIPYRLASPKIDGCLKEWIDVPKLFLDGISLSSESSSSVTESNKTSGIFQFWITEKNFFIGAAICDKSPLVNPLVDNEINRGDSVELFLGLDGSVNASASTGRNFHIGIAPGNMGRLPRLWNWTSNSSIPGGEIVACRTPDGYVMEARIPFASLGSWKPQRNLMIGFNAVLNDLDDQKPDRPLHKLVWNGNAEDRFDPSKWGLAIIW